MCVNRGMHNTYLLVVYRCFGGVLNVASGWGKGKGKI